MYLHPKEVGIYINPTARFALEGKCPVSCKALNYHWTLRMVNCSGDRCVANKDPVNDPKLFPVGTDLKEISLSYDIFTQLKENGMNRFRLRLESTDPVTNVSALAEDYLILNEPPIPGSCVADPPSGSTLKASIDGIKITCSDWYDKETDIGEYNYYCEFL
ncbi:unnamed protein product [Darwinula stevensoni]|uniref:Uncharacterized protein n=1 Tax=Darwinula stevensoni TaxID=69355 RepID=A0A7R8WYX4_9CRUS|nr:unnamed protein product [Darwinula stevensoni]CAG0879896.1 unnamed protein product [Darwinula stevensoni]